MEDLPYSDAQAFAGVVGAPDLACLQSLRPPQGGRGLIVASVAISLHANQNIRRLASLAALLLQAPVRPSLLRVLASDDLRAREVARRLPDRGLVGGARGPCVVLWDPVLALDGTECLAALAEGAGVQTLALLASPCGAGVWDVLSRVTTPSLATDEQVLGAVQTLCASVGQALSNQPWGPRVRHHVFASDSGGLRPRLLSGGDSHSRIATSWGEVCALLGIPEAAAYGEDVLCSAWVDAL